MEASFANFFAIALSYFSFIVGSGLIADKVFCEEDKVRWCTLEKAKGELQKIKDNGKHDDQKLYIEEIENFLNTEEKRYRGYLPSLDK